MHIPHLETPMEDKLEHIKKEVIPQDIMSPPFAPPLDDGNASVSTKSRTQSSAGGPIQRTGRWTPDEKILFLYGLKRFGKGRWKKMSIYLPHRSLVQIKSHAQKVLKRLESGENVFRRLEENYGIVDTLIVQAAKQRDSMALPADSKSLAAKRKLQANKTERIESEYPSTTTQLLPPNPENPSEGRGAVIAAAALCQLSSFGTTTTWEQQQPQQA